MTGEEIIDFCLDNKDLNERELKKKLLEKLEDFGPYNHDSLSTAEACNLTNSEYVQEGLPVPNAEFIKGSKLIEFYEKELTKRELSYFLVRSLNILNNMLNSENKYESSKE